ncbi:Uncharacterised protein [uncultured archaeon]|nr:Uncharacterised protein [uncultured archaeon]
MNSLNEDDGKSSMHLSNLLKGVFRSVFALDSGTNRVFLALDDDVSFAGLSERLSSPSNYRLKHLGEHLRKKARKIQFNIVLPAKNAKGRSGSRISRVT